MAKRAIKRAEKVEISGCLEMVPEREELVVIAICLGLRVTEIRVLKWADFDFEDGTLMITRGTVHGKIGRVKTEYSENEMPLDPALEAAWREPVHKTHLFMNHERRYLV